MLHNILQLISMFTFFEMFSCLMSSHKSFSSLTFAQYIKTFQKEYGSNIYSYFTHTYSEQYTYHSSPRHNAAHAIHMASLDIVMTTQVPQQHLEGIFKDL